MIAEGISSYELLGIPEALATVFVLVFLSLSLAPWLGGLEIGPLKVPVVLPSAMRWLRWIAPMALLIFVSGFIKVWPQPSQPLTTSTYTEYVRSFFDLPGDQGLKGSLFPTNELETRELQQFLGLSVWDGGSHWGTVTFNEAGREGEYTNQPGRSPGKVLIQGIPAGTVPMFFSEWHQSDGQAGRMVLVIKNDQLLEASWGPVFSVKSEWKRTSSWQSRDIN